MTFCDYTSVELGTPFEEITGCWGRGYTCCVGEDDAVEQHVYIERRERSPGYEEQHHYIFTVQEGVVVEKCYEFHEAPFRFYFTPKALPNAGYRHGS